MYLRIVPNTEAVVFAVLYICPRVINHNGGETKKNYWVA